MFQALILATEVGYCWRVRGRVRVWSKLGLGLVEVDDFRVEYLGYFAAASIQLGHGLSDTLRDEA